MMSKKIFFAAGVSILVSCFGFLFWFLVIKFRVVSVTPDNPVSKSAVITIKTNRKITNGEEILKNTSIGGGYFGINIDGNTIKIVPLFVTSDNVSVSIPEIRSGDKKISSWSKKFAMTSEVNGDEDVIGETTKYYQSKYPWMKDIEDLDNNYVSYVVNPDFDHVVVTINFSPSTGKWITDDEKIKIERDVVRSEFGKFLKLVEEKGISSDIDIFISSPYYMSYISDLMPTSADSGYYNPDD